MIARHLSRAIDELIDAAKAYGAASERHKLGSVMSPEERYLVKQQLQNTDRILRQLIAEFEDKF